MYIKNNMNNYNIVYLYTIAFLKRRIDKFRVDRVLQW